MKTSSLYSSRGVAWKAQKFRRNILPLLIWRQMQYFSQKDCCPLINLQSVTNKKTIITNSTKLNPSLEVTNRLATHEFSIFYVARKIITVFTRALYWTLSWARSTHSIPPHPISLRYILMLSSHIRLVLPSGLFPIKILYIFLFSPCVLHALLISSCLTWSF